MKVEVKTRPERSNKPVGVARKRKRNTSRANQDAEPKAKKRCRENVALGEPLLKAL